MTEAAERCWLQMPRNELLQGPTSMTYWDELLAFLASPSLEQWCKSRVIQYLPYFMITSRNETFPPKKTDLITSNMYKRIISPLDMTFYCLEWTIEWMTQVEPSIIRLLQQGSDDAFEAFSRLALYRFFNAHPQHRHAAAYEMCHRMLTLTWLLHWKFTLMKPATLDNVKLFRSFLIHPLVFNRPFSLLNVIGMNVMFDHYVLWLRPHSSISSEKSHQQWLLTFCHVLPSMSFASFKKVLTLTRHVIELIIDRIIFPQLVDALLDDCHDNLIHVEKEFNVRLVISTLSPTQVPEMDIMLVVPLSETRKKLIMSLIKNYFT